MGQKNFFILGFAVLTLAIVLLIPKPEKEDRKALLDSVKPQPKRIHNHDITVQTKKVKSIPKREASKKRRQRRELVEFELKGNLAIAYGDVILGEVDEPLPTGRGLYKAPRPRLWDTNEIPYFIHPDIEDPDRVKQALKHFESKTPIRFIELSDHEDALIFEPGKDNCYSYLGRIGGHQPIYLSRGCGWPQIAHEIMHALGFIHEHSRTDRDEYVEILWDNIKESFQNQFDVVPEALMEAVKGFPFDYQSLMLYGPQAFSKEGDLFTMKSLSNDPIPDTKLGLSEQDIERITYLYGD